MFVQKLTKDRNKTAAIANKLSMSQLLTAGLLCFTTYHAVTNKVITQWSPPYLDERMVVAYDFADSTMHLKYGLHNAILMGNSTPATIDEIVKALEMSFTPALYHSLKADLLQQAEDLKKSGSTIQFIPKNWEYEPDTQLTFVTGTQILRPVQGNPMQKTVTYEFIIEVNNYVPWIKHFALCSGVAHNQRWRDEQQSVIDI